MSRIAAVLGMCMTIAGLCCVGCSGTGAAPAGISSNAEAEKFVLTVTTNSWSGWGGGSVSTPVEQTYEVTRGEHYVVEEGPFGLAFTVIDIGNDSITIEADEEMSSTSENGGINLNDTQKKFTVKTDSKCRLATPTMDAGASYTLSLSRK